MFGRFTERARQSVVLAQEEARGLRHNYIGTEHQLLGLLREEEGIAARVLNSLDITTDQARSRVVRIVNYGDEALTGRLPFTPRAMRVYELSLREALTLGHNYIGTEHILLGLVRENKGVAARILLDFDADSEKIRAAVGRALRGPKERRTVAVPIVPDHLITLLTCSLNFAESAHRAALREQSDVAAYCQTVKDALADALEERAKELSRERAA